MQCINEIYLALDRNLHKRKYIPIPIQRSPRNNRLRIKSNPPPPLDLLLQVFHIFQAGTLINPDNITTLKAELG